MNKPTFILLIVLNVLGTILMLTINYLSISLPINNQLPQDISNRYPTIITPSGITFSIWGIIYLSLIAFLIYQITMFLRGEIYVIEKIGIWYFISCILNSAWIFAWHYNEIILSLIIMSLLLTTLMIIYKRIGIGETSGTWYDKVFFYLPFSIYTGWILIAFTLNIAITLVYLKWNGFGIQSDIWGFVVISLLTCLISTMIILKKDIFLGLTSIWALIGILIERIKDANYILTLSGVIAGLIIISVMVLYKIVKKEIYF